MCDLICVCGECEKKQKPLVRLKSTHLNFGDVLYPKLHFIQLNHARKTYVLIWEKCNIWRLIVFCEYLEI